MRTLQFRQVEAAEWARLGNTFGYVYFIRDAGQARVKIGYSTDPEARLRSLQTGSSGKLQIAGLIVGSMTVESLLHRDLAAFAVRGEWFAEAAVLGWLAARKIGGHMVADIVEREAIQVFYDWDAVAKRHVRHVWNASQNTWVREDRPAEVAPRGGWSAIFTETPDE